MRVFKSKWFERFARKEGIHDGSLLEAVDRAVRGQIDADLGGEVLKQRIARPGEGRSKGYRVILFFRRGERAFFVYGFPKSQVANISKAEETEFKEAAKHVLSLSEKYLATAVARGDFVEVKGDESEISK